MRLTTKCMHANSFAMKNHLLLGLWILIISCSSENQPAPLVEIATPTSVSLVDISNEGNASDFEVAFNLGASDGIRELRVMIVKSSLANAIDLTSALSFDASQYLTVDLADRRIQLPASQLDTDGDAIVEGSDYAILILAVPLEQDVDAKLSLPSNVKSLLQVSAVRNLTTFINAGSGGMDTDDQGNIYMGDFGANLNGGGNQVILITPEGTVSTFATGFNGASGNDFDNDGNLLQSSITGGFISKVDAQGTASTFVSTGVSGPVGVAVAADGSLFVANCGNNTISKVDVDGNATLFSDSPLLATCPNGLDIDDDGNIYTALFGNGNIIKITPQGDASVFATIPGGNNGHLLIKGSTMYVVARGAHQIYTVDMTDASVALFAGSGSRGNDNGGLAEATFSFPNDLSFSPDGTKIYVNDVDPAAGASSNISPVVIRVIELVN